MTAVCITGSNSEALHEIYNIFCVRGMETPLDIDREGSFGIDKWHSMATKEFGLNKVVGKMLDNLAVDIFLKNINADCWGWADTRSLQLLPYWAEFDPNIKFILVCESPESYLNQLIKRTSSIDEGSDPLKLWLADHRVLFDFYINNSDRAILVDSEDVIDHIAGSVGVLEEQLKVTFKNPPTDMSITPPDRISNPDDSSESLSKLILSYYIEKNDEEYLNFYQELLGAQQRFGKVEYQGWAMQSKGLSVIFNDESNGFIENCLDEYSGLINKVEKAKIYKNKLLDSADKISILEEKLLGFDEIKSDNEILMLQIQQLKLELSEVREVVRVEQQKNNNLVKEEASILDNLIRAERKNIDLKKYYENQVSVKSTEIDALAATVADKNTEIDALAATVADKNTEIDALKAIVVVKDSLADRNSTLEAELSVAHASLNGHVDNIEVLKDQLASSLMEMSKIKEESEQAISKIKDEFEILSNSKTECEQRNSILTEDLIQIQLELDRVEDENCSLKDKVNQFEANLSKIQLGSSIIDSVQILSESRRELKYQFRGYRFDDYELDFDFILEYGLLNSRVKVVNIGDGLPVFSVIDIRGGQRSYSVKNLDGKSYRFLLTLVGDLIVYLAADRRSIVSILNKILSKWKVERKITYRDIKVYGQKVNPDYENIELNFLDIEYKGINFDDWRFKLSCANVSPEIFGREPKLEFPEQDNQILDSWFLESSDESGGKCELRFAKPRSMDKSAWLKFSEEDQTFIKSLAEELPGALRSLSDSGCHAVRSWNDWLLCAEDVKAILDEKAK